MGMEANSFQVQLPSPAPSVPREGSPAAQCAVSSREPKPVAVQVSVRSNASAENLADMLYSQPSLGALGQGGLQGYIRLQYGAAGGRRILDIDVRSASFSLPPCTYAQASVRRFNEVGAVAASEFTVNLTLTSHLASIAGDLPTSTTLLVNRTAAAGPDAVLVPQGAAWWNLFTGDSLPRDTQVAGGGARADFSVPQMFPAHGAWPVPRATANLTYAGADTTDVLARFWIAP